MPAALWQGLELAAKEGVLPDAPVEIPSAGAEVAVQTEWLQHLEPLDVVRQQFLSAATTRA